MIAPERLLAQRVSGNLSLRRVQARHAFVRSRADFVHRMKPLCLSERLRLTSQERFNGFHLYVLVEQHRRLNTKSKSKTHRPNRIRRKR